MTAFTSRLQSFLWLLDTQLPARRRILRNHADQVRRIAASADSCNVARNIGIDKAWNGPYAPKSRHSRAIIMMDRIESHASAHRWCRQSSGVQQNMELVG